MCMMTKSKCGERIKTALSLRKLTQANLCELTGIPKSAMSQYINNKFEPKQDRVWKMSKVLDVSEAWLMGFDVPMDSSVQAYDENDDVLPLDDDAKEILDVLRTRPEMKILFSTSKEATKEDIEQTVKIIEALRK